MTLTHNQIAAIAKWEPIQPGFGREDNRTGIRVQEIVDRINSSRVFGCELLENDGLSNYFALFAHPVSGVPSFALERSVEGLLIYLSACAPVGVIGRASCIVGAQFRAYDPLALDMLIDPIVRAGL